MNHIDLKRELRAILYGDKFTKPQGHWVLFRYFHIGEYSKYWDEMAQQAIGGPKWKYTDFPLKTTYEPLFPSGAVGGSFYPESNGVPGQVDIASRLYILERCYRPKEGDIIIEYEGCPITDSDEVFIEYARKHKGIPYRVLHVENIRVDDNTTQYFLAWTKLDNRRL